MNIPYTDPGEGNIFPAHEQAVYEAFIKVIGDAPNSMSFDRIDYLYDKARETYEA